MVFYVRSFGVDTKYTLGTLISILQFAKIMPFLDIILLTSPYNTASADRICENNGIVAGFIFLFKVNLRLRSIQVLILAYSIGIIFFSFCIMIFEQHRDNGQGTSLSEAMWLILVTFNTIGYGDSTPETLWGRLFLVIACIWGVSIYSILVVSLQNMTIF
jgi:hypothetical protein